MNEFTWASIWQVEVKAARPKLKSELSRLSCQNQEAVSFTPHGWIKDCLVASISRSQPVIAISLG